MPTKRRFFLFLLVLAVMLLIKHALGQEAEATVGWDGDTICYPGSIASDAMGACMMA